MTAGRGLGQVTVCLQGEILGRGSGLLAFGNGFILEGATDPALGLDKAGGPSRLKPQSPAVGTGVECVQEGAGGSSRLRPVEIRLGAWKVLEQQVT